MEINYSTKDESIQVKLQYLVGQPKSRNNYGKTWAKTTQCLVFVNGFLKGFATIVKHDSDKDNMKYAYAIVTKKALINSGIYFKFIRKEIWKLLEKEIGGFGNMK